MVLAVIVLVVTAFMGDWFFLVGGFLFVVVVIHKLSSIGIDEAEPDNTRMGSDRQTVSRLRRMGKRFRKMGRM